MPTMLYQNPAAQAVRTADATLVILYGDRPVVRELGSRTDWSVGRPEAGYPQPEIPLPSPVVSRGIQGRFHCQGGAWYYQDELTVKNVTLLNGKKMAPGVSTILKNGDILRIDSLVNPHPNGVWILFSTVSILGNWDRFSLYGRSSVTIGRDPSCDIREEMPYISARHARIDVANGRVYLTDLRSMDGTWLNGQRITGPVEIHEKDWFSLCDCHFILVNNQLIYNIRRPTDQAAPGKVMLRADIVSKTVPDKNAPGGKKELLHDIHLEIKEGSLVALLGVSGAGKSTLMNCLNGFDASGVDGTVIYRGQDLYKDFQRLKREMGSVPQKNTFREVQTVEQELRCDAVLRLPGDTSRREIQENVDNTLQTLKLDKLRESTLRKLSGGEQKRVNIGVELVADRQLLCLDEPDAGLDPMTKRELFKTLRDLAHNGNKNNGNKTNGNKTIIVIIHDVAEIRLFDQVILLLKENYTVNVQGSQKEMARGRLAFSGTPAEAEQYFKKKLASDPKCQLKGFHNMADAYELVSNNPAHYIWGEHAQPMQAQPVTASSNPQGKTKRTKALSLPKEFMMSVRQFMGLLWADKRNLLISLCFPLAAAIITVFVAGENMYVHYEGTKSACFLLVSAAIWVGLFNSIQIIVRERDVIKLEYIAGRRLGCYVISKGIVQFILCLAESLLLILAFKGIVWKYDNPMPEEGVLFGSMYLEYFISVFLLMYAADTMGIFISCLVKKVETANTLSPYILIMQLVFSGVLFTLSGIMEKVSYLMLSKWGMEALGSSSSVNDWQMRIQLDMPGMIPDRPMEEMFERTAEHLTHVWVILAVFSVVFLVLGIIFLYGIKIGKFVIKRGVKDDTR